MVKQLMKGVLERAMQAELTHHVGYQKRDPAGDGNANRRNGTSRKTRKGDFGEIEIEVPRDRLGNFEPRIVPKHQRRFASFDDTIIHRHK